MLIAIALLVVALAYMTTVAGGADAYGYVSQADLWRHGRLLTDQPWAEFAPWPDRLWTFSPLGYRPDEGIWAVVPTYSAGLPMLMALAHLVAGYSAMFWVVPMSGAILVLATYGIGRRFVSSRTGLWAAWLVATSPVLLFMIMAPMSDVPVSAAWAAGFYFLCTRSTVKGAAAAGVCASIAILIRPNLFGAAALMGLLYLARKRWRDLIAFAAGVLPGMVAVALINQRLYGSPFNSGYGDLDSRFKLSFVGPNLKNYVGWLIDTQTPLAIVGLAALFAPIHRIWPRVTDRGPLVVSALFAGFLWAQYCYYQVFDTWWYLRFLLPTWPFMMIGLASVAEFGFASSRTWMRLATAALLLAVGARGIAVARDRFAFDQWRGEARYVSVARMARSFTDRNSAIVSMQHSGTVRYYGSRITLRWDWLNERWLDRTREWLISHGSHPYALLDDWEVPLFRTRFGGTSTIGRLEMKPLAIYKGGSTTYLYDLADPPTVQPEPRVVDETWDHVRFTPPAPPPRVVFSK